ncbi:hypothetical protein KFZ70_02495 [Tamlana fucoidanivorans]|uniref:Uncharacterized protein n=1 Tax=Allotamlana fucoidanivorans TaxID=2583814 RepID=A0A5C4SBA0_9FLAO|nr:hypothetical protein [Tamlana fucoidanivorans]TNJ40854.1 hypothetical protein FGF67_16730 [Tamlana fucoidanivorans]
MKTILKIFFIVLIFASCNEVKNTNYCKNLEDIKKSSKEKIETIAFEITQHEQFDFDQSETEYCMDSDKRITVRYTNGNKKLEAIIDTLSFEYLIIKN